MSNLHCERFVKFNSSEIIGTVYKFQRSGGGNQMMIIGDSSLYTFHTKYNLNLNKSFGDLVLVNYSKVIKHKYSNQIEIKNGEAVHIFEVIANCRHDNGS